MSLNINEQIKKAEAWLGGRIGGVPWWVIAIPESEYSSITDPQGVVRGDFLNIFGRWQDGQRALILIHTPVPEAFGWHKP